MMSIPLFSSLHLVRMGPKGMTRVPQKPLDILLERGERIFTSFQRPKEISHNLASQLDVRSFLEDCYLFAMAVKSMEWAEVCLHCIHLMEQQSVKRVLDEIEEEEKSAEKTRSKASTIITDPRRVTSEQAKALFERLRDSTMSEVKFE